MAQQHRNCAPHQCKTCRTTHAARVALASENPASVPTTAAVCEHTGLSRRAVQIHTVHLTAYGMLAGGLPTSVPLDPAATAPNEVLSPREWVSSLGLPCTTCVCILCIMVARARGGWSAQMGMREIAAEANLSEWTVRMHARTGHKRKGGHSLVAQGLVVFRADGEITGYDQTGRPRYVRRADRFTLAPALATAEAPLSGVEGDMYLDGLAERLRAETVWFDPYHPEAPWVLRLIAALVREGWPEEFLLARLRVTPHRMPIKLPYRFARVRLPKRGEPYIAVPEADAWERPRCANPACRVRLQRATADGLCAECRQEAAQRPQSFMAAAPAQRTRADAHMYALAGPAAPPPF